ncbi:MFS transporter [candidate division KSB1 bacterium]|nr:MFS transporter [candidate division KSB1 bacterium]RQW00769.1 MAG: MFS transporter [candidate division KSB1 bacterium]
MQASRVVGLSMGHFVNDMYVGFLAPLLPLIIAKIDITLTMAAGLTSILSTFTSLAQPAFGHIADKIRRPFLAALGPLLTALFFSAIGWVDSYVALVALIVVGGIGTAAFHPQAAALVGRTSGRQSGLSMSIFVTGGSAGYYTGPIVIMSIVTWLGLEYSFISFLPGMLISIFLLFVLPKLPRSLFHSAKISGTVRVSHRFRSIILLFCISTIRSFIVSGFNTFIPIYLEAQNVAPMLYAAALTTFGMPGAAGSLIGGFLSDLLGRRKVIFASLAVAMPFLGLFLLLDNFWSIICLAIAGFAIFSSIPVVIIMAQELFPARINTASSLVMGMSWGVSGLLVTPLGLLAEHIGVAKALTSLVFLGAIGCLLTLFLPETKRGGV